MHVHPNTPSPRARHGHRSYRLVRQLHLWIGAWGALPVVLYGFTGLVMNHRGGDGAWPQGDSTETAREAISVGGVSLLVLLVLLVVLGPALL